MTLEADPLWPGTTSARRARIAPMRETVHQPDEHDGEHDLLVGVPGPQFHLVEHIFSPPAVGRAVRSPPVQGHSVE